MQHQEIDPPAALREVVQDFWYICQDAEEPSTSLEVAPDGHAEIIFSFGGPCSVATHTGWQLLPSPFLVGLLRQPAHFQAEGRLELLGIKCFPWAVFGLLGQPAGASVRSLGQPLAGLQAPLAACLAAGDVAAALAQLASYCEQAYAGRTADPLLGRAGGALRTGSGALPVGEVAAAAYATPRTLERRFRQAAGRTVKDVSGLLRFEQACRRLWLHPATSLAGLAQELGYADQSHLGREFRRYSGTTPAAFARRAARWQQVAGSDFVAFLLA